ncbi:MAG: YitT family protein [Mycoplasmatales bacterium]
MINFFKTMWQDQKKQLVYMVFGTFIYVVGINLFLTPLQLFPSGLMGLAIETTIIMKNITGINLSSPLIYFIYNIPLIIISFKYVGKKFTYKTVFIVALTSILSALIPSDIDFVQNIMFSGIQLTEIEVLIISASIAAILGGMGVGYMLKAGASGGGADIVSVFFSLFKGKSVGFIQLVLNIVIIIIAIALTGVVATGIFMFVYIYISAVATDKTFNIHDKYTLFVVTSQAEKIKEEIFANYYRGVTLIDSKGGYTNSPNNTLMITIDKSEVYNFIEIVKKHDQGSFINVFIVHSVIGAYEESFKRIL